MTPDMKPILVIGTDLPLGVYRAEPETVEVHRYNYRFRVRSTEPDAHYDPNRPVCPRKPCYGREDECPNVEWETAYRLVPA